MKNLKIYFIVIAILLALILFIIPDDVFLKYLPIHPQKIEIKEEKKEEFKPLSELEEKLLNNDYEYKITFQDNTNGSRISSCTGKVKDKKETGICKNNKEIKYTDKTKEDAYLKLGIKYINEAHIFKLISDKKPEVIQYENEKIYKFKITLLKKETIVTITTSFNEIKEISLDNIYLNYHFKYNALS